MSRLLSLLVCGVAFIQMSTVVSEQSCGFALQDASHWTYNRGEAAGPENWGSLSPDYWLCSNGTSQSPIDVDTTDAGSRDDITPLTEVYMPAQYNAVLTNTGHTIQVSYPPGSYITGGPLGDTYNLIQFHFHTPSEHAIDGTIHPMELHFVHRNAAGRLAVVCILFRQTKNPSRLLNEFVQYVDQVPNTGNSVNISIDLNLVLPSTRAYWTYNGSLTTPPCSESVIWLVMEEPLEATFTQIELLHRKLIFDARPLQARNRRPVIRYQVSRVPGNGDGGSDNTGGLVALALLLLIACGALGFLSFHFWRKWKRPSLSPVDFANLESQRSNQLAGLKLEAAPSTVTIPDPETASLDPLPETNSRV